MERYARRFSLPENQYQKDSPLLIAAGALLVDTATGNPLVQLKFSNISTKTVKNVKVRICAFDASGAALPGVNTFTYKNLNAASGEDFGTQTPIPLPKDTTVAFKVEILSVGFADGSTYTPETIEVATASQSVLQTVSEREEAQRKKFIKLLAIPLVLCLAKALVSLIAGVRWLTACSSTLGYLNVLLVCTGVICAETNRRKAYLLSLFCSVLSLLSCVISVVEVVVWTEISHEAYYWAIHILPLLLYASLTVILVMWGTKIKQTPRNKRLERRQKNFLVMAIVALILQKMSNSIYGVSFDSLLLSWPFLPIFCIVTAISAEKNRKVLLTGMVAVILNAVSDVYSASRYGMMISIALNLAGYLLMLAVLFLQYREARKSEKSSSVE